MKKEIQLARKAILKMSGYQSAKTITQNLSTDTHIHLDANLNPYLPYPQSENLQGYNCYPDPQPEKLKTILADLYGVKNDSVLITRGSDEGIDILVRTFCEANADSIIICPPTFGMYKVSANIQGANVISIPLLAEKSYQLDVQSILQHCDKNSVKLVFLPCPNAPIGHMMCRADIEKLCKALQGKTLVVIDEAYIEFTEYDSMCESLQDYGNLIVLRTTSKAYAMAGLRIGATLADRDIIGLLKKVQAPYPLTVPSIDTATQALTPAGLAITQDYICEITQQRRNMYDRLQKLPYIDMVYESVTNFILIQTQHDTSVMEFLQKNGVILRSQSGQLPNSIRITISKKSDNDIVWNVLQKYSDS